MAQELTVKDLARAVQIILTCLVLGVSYFNIRLSNSIPVFESIFMDMMSGKPLPMLTQFVISTAWAFNIMSVLILPLSIALFFIRRPVMAIYWNGALLMVCMGSIILITRSMYGPLIQLFMGLNGPPGI